MVILPKQKYMCDFETTTTATDCRVWAWCGTHISDQYDYHCDVGISINSFMEWMFDRAGSTFYFHNAKFDTDFIIQWLFRNGYSWVNLKAPKKPGQFTTLIADTGQLYALKIYPVGGKQAVTIHDSYKLIALSVADTPKAFGLTETKLSIDYDEFRPIGHALTNQEIEYVKADCIIMAKALDYMFSQGLDKITAASNAMQYYRNLIGKKTFEKWFPCDIESDNVIRKAYYGGAVMVNPDFQGKILHNIRVYDVNSHFPAQLRYKLMPYGKPHRFEGEYQPNKSYPLYVQTLQFECRLKEGHLPCIPKSHGFIRASAEWLESTLEPMEMNGQTIEVEVPATYTLTNIDLEMLREHYDLANVKYLGGYMMRGQYGMFDTYIDYWMNVKATAKKEGNAGMAFVAKLFLNSFYGKFGTNPIKGKKEPYLGKNGETAYRNIEKEIGKPIYVAIAAFTTAYARQITLGMANKFKHRFIYCDTDSLHLLGKEEPEGLDIDKYRLGAWDNEYNAKFGKYLGAKCYYDWMCEIKPNVYKQRIIKCAGMQARQKKKIGSIWNFKEGLEIADKLLPKRVEGGTILQATTFKIKERKKNNERICNNFNQTYLHGAPTYSRND